MSKYDDTGSDQFRPISPWAYVGYSILFLIPIIGQLCLILFTFSRKNINRRSFARSYWCRLLIAILLLAVVVIAVPGQLTALEKLEMMKDRTAVFFSNIFRFDDPGVLGSIDGDSAASPLFSKTGANTFYGVTPAFKEAMDSYESFFDKYAAFMQKYYNSNDTASMLADYTDYMSRYTDMIRKIESIDENTLSAADDAYYLEVSVRINKKLSELPIQQ